MVCIGGASSFAGPILGAVLMTLLQVYLPDVTPAWQLYLGLLFVFVVMFVPGGLAGVIAAHARLLRAGQLPRLLRPYAMAALPVLAVGSAVCIGMDLMYRLSVGFDGGAVFRIGPVVFDAASVSTWVTLGAWLLAGLAAGARTLPGAIGAFESLRLQASQGSGA
ncbi:MAG: hypothetical protein ACREBE_20750, partial [bacterium]